MLSKFKLNTTKVLLNIEKKSGAWKKMDENGTGTSAQAASGSVPEDETGVTSGGECGSEWVERGDHPLLNDLILDTFFEHVRRCDLKASRGVCKKWNLRTIPHMRATFRVTIRRTQYMNGNSLQIDPNARQFYNFVERFKYAHSGLPFETFGLEPFKPSYGGRFLQLCGDKAKQIDFIEPSEHIAHTIEDVSILLREFPKLEVLGLPSVLVSSYRNVVKLFPDSTPTFPSLKKLTVSQHPYSPRSELCPTLFVELFMAAPNISEMTVKDMRHENSVITDVLDGIEKLGMESSIQSLHLINADIDHVERLKRMNGLKLKNLAIEQSRLSEDPLEFDTAPVQLATVFKDTLQSLHLDLLSDNYLNEFPMMPHLKSLTFCVYDDNPYGCPPDRYGSCPKETNLNEMFPSLETLKLLHVGDHLNEYFSQFHSTTTIKALLVDTGAQNMKIHTFHDILRVFPNLTKLSLGFRQDGLEILREVWTKMTGLESLSISGQQIVTRSIDTLFTGIPIQILEEIRHIVNDLEDMTSQERRDTILKLRNQYSGIPAIVNLKNLRHLKLNVTGGVDLGNQVGLSDATAYLALHLMDRLRHLEVENCRFTKASCEFLTFETGLEYWKFWKEQKENIIPPFVLNARDNDSPNFKGSNTYVRNFD